MKRFLKILLMSIFFLASFMFFLFFTFPYEVLKEAVASDMSKMSGYSIKIGELGPAFPFGLSAEKVEVVTASNVKVKFKELEVTVGILPILIGNLSTELEVKATENDFLRVSGTIGVFSLLSGGVPVPKSISLKARKFPLNGIMDFILLSQANLPGANPMVAPLLKQIKISAKMKSDITADIDIGSPKDSSGELALKLTNASLAITDPSLDIPVQNFDRAQINATLAKGILSIKSKSGFQSSDLLIDISGKMTVKAPIDRSSLGMGLEIKLQGALKEQFGFVMDAVSGLQSDGKMSLKVSGTMSKPNVSMY